MNIKYSLLYRATLSKKNIASLVNIGSVLGLSIFLTACNNTPTQQVQVAKSQYLTSNYRASFYTTYNAAQLGNRDAEYALGYFYYYGIGVPRDVVKGRIWISKAANHGLPAAIEAMQLMNRAAPTPFTQNGKAGSNPMSGAPGQQPMMPSQPGGATMPPPSMPSGQQSAPSEQRSAPPPPPNIKIARPSLRMDTSDLDYYTPPVANSTPPAPNAAGGANTNPPAANANPPAAANNATAPTTNNPPPATSSSQPAELGAPPAAPSQPASQPQPSSTQPTSMIGNQEPASTVQ